MMNRHQLLDIALAELGVRETPGDEHTTRVLEYFHASGHDWVGDDETAWCAAFVGWALKAAGLEGTGSLLARSYLEWGQPTEDPAPGDLVVFWRVAKDSQWGHVGFYLNRLGNDIYVLGGNQNNGVTIEIYSAWRLLGYRRA